LGKVGVLHIFVFKIVCPMKILIIEDEPKLVSILREGLENDGFETEVAYDGQIGERLAVKNFYDLIILDVILPYINGLELCKSIRKSNISVPILMLTALASTDDKVAGFDAGADDYLAKPFEFKELLARVRALLKRATGIIQHSNSIKIADLELDLDKKTALRGGYSIDLTSKEFFLLEYLMRNKGRVLSRVDIAEKVWDIDFDANTNIIDVYINILRKKIDKDFETKLIHTRKGLGYYIDC
jgi:two-component system, OmpR family, copper resistance phosphate regulon response regulator CusR